MRGEEKLCNYKAKERDVTMMLGCASIGVRGELKRQKGNSILWIENSARERQEITS